MINCGYNNVKIKIRLEKIKIVAIKARIMIEKKTWLSQSGCHGNTKFVGQKIYVKLLDFMSEFQLLS